MFYNHYKFCYKKLVAFIAGPPETLEEEITYATKQTSRMIGTLVPEVPC